MFNKDYSYYVKTSKFGDEYKEYYIDDITFDTVVLKPKGKTTKNYFLCKLNDFKEDIENDKIIVKTSDNERLEFVQEFIPLSYNVYMVNQGYILVEN
jgi:hypothetical protein